MRHFRLNANCSRCDLEAMMLNDDIPLVIRVDVFERLRDLHYDVPDAIDAFERTNRHNDIFTLQSEEYSLGNGPFSIWVSVAHNGSFIGLLHVLPRFTSRTMETVNAVNESLSRLNYGVAHDNHDHSRR